MTIVAGNVRGADGEPGGSNTNFPMLPRILEHRDPTYDPETRHPVYHTDSLYRANAPIGRESILGGISFAAIARLCFQFWML